MTIYGVFYIYSNQFNSIQFFFPHQNDEQQFAFMMRLPEIAFK